MSKQSEAAEKALTWANRAEEYAQHWPNPSSTDYRHLSAASDMAVMWAKVADIVWAAERRPQADGEAML